MQFTNIHPQGEVEIPLIRQVVAAGEAFDVDDEHVQSFLDQPTNYAPVDEKAAKAWQKKHPVITDEPETVDENKEDAA